MIAQFKRRRWFILILTCFLLGLSFPVESASISYFPFSQIKRGMKAVGKTVFYGTEVEDFQLEVMDVVEGKKVEESYFVVKVTDKKLEEMGGLSAGMSGSPIFIRGKIAGALSYSWETKDNLVGVVTPIEAMLPLWEEDLWEEEAIQGEEVIQEEKPISFSPLVPESTIFVLGLGERASSGVANKLRERFCLKEIFTVPVLSWGKKRTSENDSLQPGSAIGIQLVRGDAEVMSIGTLTLRDEDRILALGHPFLHRGEANYFLSSVYVNFSLQGANLPFKVGKVIKEVGIIDQDRSAGVAGKIGVMPEVSKIVIKVRNEGKEEREYSFEVVRDEDILVDMLPELVLDAIDRSIDSQMSGSANVNLNLEGEDFSWQEEFFWISDSDIASATSSGLGEVFKTILNNPCRKLNLSEVSIEVDVISGIQHAWLTSLDLPKVIGRNKEMEGKVNLFLWREGERGVSFPFLVPADFLPGAAEITVRGKSSGNLELETNKEEASFSSSLYDYLQKRLDNLHSEGLVVEIFSKAGSFPQDEKVYFTQWVGLPLILEGSVSEEVWIR